MKSLFIAATLTVTLGATFAAPATAGDRDDRRGYGRDFDRYDRGYRRGNAYGHPGRARFVPVYGGYYAPPRVVRYHPAYFPPPVVRYRPGFYAPPVIYGGYAQAYPVPVPVPVAAPVVYGGYDGYGGYPQQGFYDPCRSTGAGAVIGAIAGGVIGNSVAGWRDRGLGTVVGAGIGAVAGTAIERNQRCPY